LVPRSTVLFCSVIVFCFILSVKQHSPAGHGGVLLQA
jgi:hypothetical protein